MCWDFFLVGDVFSEGVHDFDAGFVATDSVGVSGAVDVYGCYVDSVVFTVFFEVVEEVFCEG